MIEINVKEARSKLSSLLNRVAQGEEIVITRRGQKVALLVSADKDKQLQSMKEFRSSLTVSGEPLSKTVIELRREDRF
jgi:prevent-host-death family protein